MIGGIGQLIRAIKLVVLWGRKKWRKAQYQPSNTPAQVGREKRNNEMSDLFCSELSVPDFLLKQLWYSRKAVSNGSKKGAFIPLFPRMVGWRGSEHCAVCPLWHRKQEWQCTLSIELGSGIPTLQHLVGWQPSVAAQCGVQQGLISGLTRPVASRVSRQPEETQE